MYSLEVFDPTGTTEVTKSYAPRLDTLEGKTICELSNNQWQAHRTFPLIRELLQKRFPSVKIIPYTEFPAGTSEIDSDKVVDLIKERGGQAVIVGNAA